jgi:hypothetical protein
MNKSWRGANLLNPWGRPAVMIATMGGLGNRVRALLSAANIADELDRDFYFSWKRDANFKTSSSAVWKFPGAELSGLAGMPLGLRWGTQDPYSMGLPSRRVLVFRTPHAIESIPTQKSWQDRFRELRLPPERAAEIERFYVAELSGTRYVGVMVRASVTAHPKTRDTSPPQWFLDRMRQLRDEDSDIEFFLSCDHIPTTTWLTENISGVHSFPKQGLNDSRQGIIEAASDLYLLSGSSGLLGPYWSSFVDLAQALRPSLALETPKSDTAERLTAAGLSQKDDSVLLDQLWH